MRLTVPILALTAGALALSGCAATSNASTTTGHSAAVGTAAKPAPASAKSSAAVTTSSKAAGAVSAKAAVCDALGLTAAAVDTQAGAGSVTTGLRITNVNVRHACRLPGRLHVTLNDGTATVATAKPGPGSDTTIVLEPKKSVTAVLKTANGSANLPSGQRCGKPGRLVIELPGNPVHSTLAESTEQKFRSCGGITVSAFGG